jgi:probable addiction module antidote protein
MNRRNNMEDTIEEKVTFEKWDLADYINSKEDVIGILEAALEENDTALLFEVVGDIARSKGMTQIAQDLNLARENLNYSFSQDGNPSFNTVAKVLDNLGFQLSVRQKVPA